MAISTYQEISWGNPESFYLSQVWSLYCRQIDWTWQLCNLGYYGLADPMFGSKNPNPDILAFHPDMGDVQHIHITGFEDYEFGDNIEADKEQISSEFSDCSESNSVTNEIVSEYLSSRNHEFSPSIQEVVCVVPKSVYDQYETHVKREANDKDLIIWLIDSNGKTLVWKEEGNHSNLALDEEISSRLKAYPSSNDVLQYSRSTNQNRLEYEFIARMVRHCGRMGIREISFSEVDEIMVSTSPPILGHIPKEDREEEFWANFLYNMLNTYDLLEQSESESDTYIWKGQKFVNEPRYRHRILKDVGDELDITVKGGL